MQSSKINNFETFALEKGGGGDYLENYNRLKIKKLKRGWFCKQVRLLMWYIFLCESKAKDNFLFKQDKFTGVKKSGFLPSSLFFWAKDSFYRVESFIICIKMGFVKSKFWMRIFSPVR